MQGCIWAVFITIFIHFCNVILVDFSLYDFTDFHLLQSKYLIIIRKLIPLPQVFVLMKCEVTEALDNKICKISGHVCHEKFKILMYGIFHIKISMKNAQEACQFNGSCSYIFTQIRYYGIPKYYKNLKSIYRTTIKKEKKKKNLEGKIGVMAAGKRKKEHADNYQLLYNMSSKKKQIRMSPHKKEKEMIEDKSIRFTVITKLQVPYLSSSVICLNACFLKEHRVPKSQYTCSYMAIRWHAIILK